MSRFSGLEISLSFLCGCVFLGCAAEVYYLLWWKNRRINIENQTSSVSSSSSSNYTPTHLFSISCWKTSKFSKAAKFDDINQDPNMGLVQDLAFNGLKKESLDLENQNSNDAPIQMSSCISCWKPSKNSKTNVSNKDPNMTLVQEQVSNGSEEESFDLELMRLHNLHGPPRFLTTINEETKEDLESLWSRNCSRTRSLSDLVAQLDTPQPSPPLRGSNFLNLESFQFYHNELNINPLFESDMKILRSSPPPTFKFLRDAEEKLLKRLVELEAVKTEGNSLVILAESKGKIGVQENNQISGGSKVIPLGSSPSNS